MIARNDEGVTGTDDGESAAGGDDDVIGDDGDDDMGVASRVKPGMIARDDSNDDETPITTEDVAGEGGTMTRV